MPVSENNPVIRRMLIDWAGHCDRHGMFAEADLSFRMATYGLMTRSAGLDKDELGVKSVYDDSNFVRKHVKTVKKDGYILKTELVNLVNDLTSPSAEITSTYTPEGYYIGDEDTAKDLIVKRGIKPELNKPGNEVCSIGFSEKSNEWFGWSHRAIKGFKPGDEGYIATPNFEGTTGKKLSTLAECKKAAQDFAESVS